MDYGFKYGFVSHAPIEIVSLNYGIPYGRIVTLPSGRVISGETYHGFRIYQMKGDIPGPWPIGEATIEEVTVVALSAYPGQTWHGTVRRLPYPYGTGGGTGGLEDTDKSVRVSLEGDPSDLKLGDLARVTVVLEEKDDVLWLPPVAISIYQGRKFVIVQEDDRQRRADVKIGIESADRVEILEGVEEGHSVVGQ